MLKHFILSLVVLLVCACQPSLYPTNMITESSLKVAATSGIVEFQPTSETDFKSLLTNQSIHGGDRLRTSSNKAAFIEIRDERSVIAIGPESKVTITAISGENSITKTRLTLEEGGVFVAAEQPLGEGFLEVSTPGGNASLHGSSMVINIDAPTQQTVVSCTHGAAVVQSNGGMVNLMAGQSTTFSSSASPGAPQTLDQQIYDKYPQFWEMWADKYLKALILEEPTFTPEPSRTTKPTATTTITPKFTWTPFPVMPTSTVRVDSAIPTRRPTITVIPGFSGLTPEELANQGTFPYNITCQAWGNCVCDSANATPQQILIISFGINSVTLAGGPNEVLSYEKIYPNLYRQVDQTITAEINFLMEGFEFFVTKAGRVCQLQTFTRVDD